MLCVLCTSKLDVDHTYKVSLHSVKNAGENWLPIFCDSERPTNCMVLVTSIHVSDFKFSLCELSRGGKNMKILVSNHMKLVLVITSLKQSFAFTCTGQYFMIPNIQLITNSPVFIRYLPSKVSFTFSFDWLL